MTSYWAEAHEHTLFCVDGDERDEARNSDGERVYDGDDLDAAKAAVLGFVAENPCTVNYNGDSLYENIGSLTFHEVELYEVADGDGDDIEIMRTDTIDAATAKAWAEPERMAKSARKAAAASVTGGGADERHETIGGK